MIGSTFMEAVSIKFNFVCYSIVYFAVICPFYIWTSTFILPNCSDCDGSYSGRFSCFRGEYRLTMLIEYAHFGDPFNRENGTTFLKTDTFLFYQ